MPRERKCKYESLTIRQANHKNSAEEAQLGVVCKFLKHERGRISEDLDKDVRRIKKEVGSLHHTRPIPGEMLNLYHREQKTYMRDVCVHIVNCYMCRQDRNKLRWLKRRQEKGINALPQERPVTTPDHLQFVHKAFPEIYNFSVGYDWSYDRASNVDIYEHGRAGHDMKCMSTRAKPIGNYRKRGPKNFRFFSPEPEETEAKPGEERLPGIQHQNSVVNVPDRGLARVDKKGVHTLEDNRGDEDVVAQQERIQDSSEHQTISQRQQKRMRKSMALLVQGIADGRILTERQRQLRFNQLLKKGKPQKPTSTPETPDYDIKLPPVRKVSKRRGTVVPL